MEQDGMEKAKGDSRGGWIIEHGECSNPPPINDAVGLVIERANPRRAWPATAYAEVPAHG